VTGQCKLCLRPEETLRNSHIIPEFNYLTCYDEKHRFHVLSTSGPKHDRYQQMGIREHLLCQTCETHLSKYEGYAKTSVFEDGLSLRSRNEFAMELDGVDYEKFRIYGLSLLWRMSVSTLPMFREVKLGPHEEVIRSHVRSGVAPPPDKYPFLLAAVRIGGQFRTEYIVQPSLSKDCGQHIYRVPIGGIIYSFFVASHPVEPDFQRLALTSEGTLPVLIAPLEKVPFLVGHFTQLSGVIS